jgi:ribosomal protein L31
MTATNKERLAVLNVEFPHKGTFPAASGAGPFYAGTLVVMDAAGRAAVPTPGGTGDGFMAAGLSVATQSNVGGAAGTVPIEVSYGVHPFLIQGATPKPGQLAYVVDNQTISITTGPTGARGGAGLVTEVIGAVAYVLIGPLVWSKFAAAGATGAATA